MKKFTLPILFISMVNMAYTQQTVGLFLNGPYALNGYTLFSNNEKTYLIDNCGYSVHTWESEYKPGLGIYLLENGELLRSGKVAGHFTGGGLGGIFERSSWEGDLLWQYKYASSSFHAHHDIEPLPNGNFLAIAWEKHSEQEAKQNGRKHDGEVWSEKVVEIEMQGNDQASIVWEWRLWDHLIQDHDSTKPNFGTVSEHPELVDINYVKAGEPVESDWIHFNAISYNAQLDQIAVSSRNFSEIWIIDHSTSTAQAAAHSGGNSGMGGDLLYRFGNPYAYKRGGSNDQSFFEQHDIRWTLDGGQLMVFNNLFESGKSAVQIWTPPLAGSSYTIENGQPFGPDFFDWEFSEAGFYSKIMSGAHELPNGNILICEADDGHLREVTPEQELVWEYINPVNSNGFPVSQGGTPLFNDLFRATKYAADYPAFSGKDLTPGPPIETNPWPIDCELTDTKEKPHLSDLDGISIINNLSAGVLNVESKLFGESTKMCLANSFGQIFWSGKIATGPNEISTSQLGQGIYFLVFVNERGILFHQKIVVAR